MDIFYFKFLLKQDRFINILYNNNNNMSSIVSIEQIQSLHDFFINTNGTYWNWQYPYDIYGVTWNFILPLSSNTTNPCNITNGIWQGLSCNCNFNNNCMIVNISLPSYNLTGKLGLSLNNLVHLSNINLVKNFLTGELSSTILEFENLRSLKLSFNNFTGTIPKDFFTNSLSSNHIRTIEFEGNRFTGILPSIIDSNCNFVKSLIKLSFSDNYLTGTLEKSFGLFTNLERLYLWG
jgi:hypothetical protein